MRGIVSRRGRRAGSILLGLGLAAAFGCATSGIATAKAPAVAKPPVTAARFATPSVKGPNVVAHSAGHKIARPAGHKIA